VIKTGLRKISLSYSRISLAEIAQKLHLVESSSLPPSLLFLSFVSPSIPSTSPPPSLPFPQMGPPPLSLSVPKPSEMASSTHSYFPRSPSVCPSLPPLPTDGPASAEFVCAKAIRDGVIDALLDHEAGFLQSREVNDVYSTTEPQQVTSSPSLPPSLPPFCLDVHNEAPLPSLPPSLPPSLLRRPSTSASPSAWTCTTKQSSRCGTPRSLPMEGRRRGARTRRRKGRRRGRRRRRRRSWRRSWRRIWRRTSKKEVEKEGEGGREGGREGAARRRTPAPITENQEEEKRKKERREVSEWEEGMKEGLKRKRKWNARKEAEKERGGKHKEG